MNFVKNLKLGFIGTGNMAQTIIKGLIENNKTLPQNIMGCNRSPGKLQKLVENYQILSASSADAVIDFADIVILAVKPQDFIAAVEPISRQFQKNQIVISLAAGIQLNRLKKLIPETRVCRLIPNTPSIIGRGVLGFYSEEKDDSILSVVEDLVSSLGHLIVVDDEEKLEAITVASASGTGFVFEMMLYWQEWLEEHGFTETEARQITVETFLGTSMLASQNKQNAIEELQARVTSKKGVTLAGLSSMRELEIERSLRISFEKAAMRSSELANEIK
jgi:pyrroline-5-carboxylate reductase